MIFSIKQFWSILADCGEIGLQEVDFMVESNQLASNTSQDTIYRKTLPIKKSISRYKLATSSD